MGSRATRSKFKIRSGDAPRFCTSRKACYIDYQDALSAAELAMERGDALPCHHMTPYQCPHCRWFHIFNRRIVFKDSEPISARQ